MKSKIYNVVDIYDFLDHLISTELPGSDSNDLMIRISDSSKVSFGDAFDTIIFAKDVCDILDCKVPADVDPNTLIGLGS
jgi:hypothetical protein